VNVTWSELADAALRAPFTRRARREFAYCVAGLLPSIGGWYLLMTLLLAGGLLTISLIGLFLGLIVLVLALRLARGLGGLHRRLASRLLRRDFAPPAPFRPERGLLRRVDARLRDGTAWRAVGYVALKLPVSVLQGYAACFWVIGAIDVLRAVWSPLLHGGLPESGYILTPLFVGFGIPSWLNSFAAFTVGAVTLLVAPWITRAAAAGDSWLIRALLGPPKLAERVRELEESRALAVDDAAAALRQVERNLHDGAQVRLAALAMGLGMAKEKLGDDGQPLELEQAERIRELVDSAHRSAKEALVELRDLARGIHPPVLDAGLAEALATLAARSMLPVSLTTSITDRPRPAIETIAYFCAAELLANAAKHSGANRVVVDVTQHDGVLMLQVNDDGIGGADVNRGSGLLGLVQRVRTVDGRLHVSSPPGGPTVVTVELPLRA
jgi:signal transduction histidine kinase